MLEDALAIPRVALEELRGGVGRAREGGQRIVQLAALLADLADEVQRARAVAERGGVEAAGILHGVVGERLLADGVERIEPAHGIELAAQVAEHELEQVFGLRTLALRLGARVHRRHRENGHQGHSRDGRGRDHRHAPRAPLRVAAHEFVHADACAQHARDELERREALAIAHGTGTQVGGDGLGRGSARSPLRCERVAQRLGKTLLGLAARDAAGEGFARRDEREDARFAVQFLELDDFAVHPFGARRIGRTHDDQVAAAGQRFTHARVQVRARLQFLAVAKHGLEEGGHLARRRTAPHEPARDAIRFQRALQRRGDGRIAMAVADEGPESRRSRIQDALPCKMSPW